MPAVARTSSSFLFLAARPDGGRRLGVRRARDRRHLAEQLRRERLVPLRTWTVPEWATPTDKVRLKDQGEVHTQLAQLLTRGVPLVEALEVTSQAVAVRTRPRIERIRELVAAGTGFADACQQVGLFDHVTVAVYRAAERTGDLPGAAKQLAKTVRRQLNIRGKVGTVMMYPAIVLSIAAVISTIMIVVVVPMIGSAITNSGGRLPLVTAVLVNTGLFIRAHGAWVALAAGGVVIAGVALRKSLLALVMRFARRLPLMRDVILMQESARFFTVMSAMVRSGVTLADALSVGVGVVGHPVLKTQLATLRTRLIEGGLLRTLIDGVTALPLPIRRLLIAAERSGDMESAFETLAEDTTEELDRLTGRLVAALEPVLILVMFFVIATLLLSIMIPLIQATTHGIE